MRANERRGLIVGLVVGLLASAGLAARYGAWAFMLSAVTVVLVLAVVSLVVRSKRD